MQPVIETVHLYKRFGTVTALDDVNIAVARGEFVAIMGSSGSGKTTLMNILSCLDTPTEGKVLLNGTDAAALDEEARRAFRARTIGLVFQQFHLLPYLTACENVMLAQYYHSVTDKTAALAALERVGLAHRSDHLPKQLSGGEQQRVCIARAHSFHKRPCPHNSCKPSPTCAPGRSPPSPVNLPAKKTAFALNSPPCNKAASSPCKKPPPAGKYAPRWTYLTPPGSVVHAQLPPYKS